uniref:Uncharacterized protein n=1 Tax=Physcomitrium patens TaxID=3218 RepID=A0A2K1K378_PHYPA|nr:hypothetical protein PHYPA_012704 [Physcomitrium patens]
MIVQLDILNDEMKKKFQLLRHLSERNAALKKEKHQAPCKLQRESALNTQASRMLMHCQTEDHDIDLCDAKCQTICFCQQVDTRKRRRAERKERRCLEEAVNSYPSRPPSPPQMRKSDTHKLE